MKKSILMTLCMMLAMTYGYAQQKTASHPSTAESFSQSKIFTLKGKIYEAHTKIQLLESYVEILSATDSTVIVSTNAIQKYRSGNDTYYTSEFNLNIPKEEGEYIVRVSKKGYETTCLAFSLKNLYKREFSRTIPDI